MIHTRVCDLLGIQHPILLGGMGGGHTDASLVAAVCNAGGFGTFGCAGLTQFQIHEAFAAIRSRTRTKIASAQPWTRNPPQSRSPGVNPSKT